jgi:photosystem II stability/assembly factor-like uncharacterized protein
MLAGGATSSGKVWNFLLGSSVTSFTLQVFVRARTPQPAGILRWIKDTLGSTGTLFNAWGNSATDAYVVGVFVDQERLGGRMLHWDGASWSTVKDFSDLTYGIWATGTNLVVAGPDGVVQHSTDAGAHWSRHVIAPNPLLGSVWGSSSNDLFIAGSSGTILHSTDGEAWTPMASGSLQYLNQVWGRSATDVYIVGYGGTILHYDGANWAAAPPPAGYTGRDFLGVGGPPGGDVIAVGSAGSILRRTNGAGSWNPEASGTTANLNAVWCVAATDCVAVGDQGTVVRWNGSLWSPMASGTTQVLRGVWGASLTQAFVTGDLGTVLRGVR